MHDFSVSSNSNDWPEYDLEIPKHGVLLTRVVQDEQQQIQDVGEDDQPDSLWISFGDISKLNGEGITERHANDDWKLDYDHVHNVPCRFQSKGEYDIYHDFNSTYQQGMCPFTIKEDCELLWDSDENYYLW